jgi:hypothetical protein
MSENTTRFFRLDDAPEAYRGHQNGGSVLLPDRLDPSGADDDFVISPLAGSLAGQPSIDARLREELKPVIHDINILRPENYHTMSMATCDALVKHSQNEQAGEAKEALTALVELLKENIELESFLDQSMNRIHKA